jgi:aspartyl protease family protein
MMGRFVLLVVVLAGVLLLFRNDFDFLAGMETTEIVIVAGAIGLMLLYALTGVAGERSRPLRALRYLVIWTGIILALVAGYGYREELSGIATRVAGELMPPGETVALSGAGSGEKSVRVRRRLDGHFVVRGEVNDQNMLLLVDTGASTVVLKPSDAARAGIDTDALDFSVPVHTANGTAYAAPVKLRSIAVGPLVIDNVEALVAKPGSVNENLLGMSFLRRLRSYEFSKDFLTLKAGN